MGVRMTESLVFDIETCPLDGAAEYVPAPDMDAIQPAKNLKDPAKIAEDIAKRKADAAAGHAAALGKAALDFNLARIVAIGWTAGDAVVVKVCESEQAEAGFLEDFWAATHRRQLIGFRVRTFDLPMLMARSRYLNVRHPPIDLSRYSRSGRVTDLWDVLTYGLSDYETTSVMPRRLKTYAKRYGLAVDDAVDGAEIGAEIPALVAAGDWGRVVSHVTSDVQLTAALARRLGVMQDESARVA
jgi:hypothetical protein